MRIGGLFALVVACAPPSGDVDGTPAAEVIVTDVGPASGYDDHWFGTYKRGRGNVVADFDGDGDVDVFSGNPGNQSFLLRNVTEPGGPIRFESWQLLSEDGLFYGGVAADFDNDGDQDLFVSAGANDGTEADRYYRNDGDPDAPLVDASSEMGIVAANGTMGVRAFDADNDGRLDLWASNFAPPSALNRPAEENGPTGQNQLYLSGRTFRLEDRAVSLGLSQRRGSRHASVFDFDRDGDMDVYENNFIGLGTLWRNRLVEDGVLSYEDVTDALTLAGNGLGGTSVNQAMCSLVGDLDNDGWEDLVVLHRGRDSGVTSAMREHQVFMNVEGQGFVDVGSMTGLSREFGERTEQTDTSLPMSTGWGVMGCQIGDINLDGFPDVFMGTGSGGTGDVNQLFVSNGRRAEHITGVGDVMVPTWVSWSDLLDAPSDLEDDVPYPYRSHGTAFADFDGDGVSEIGVHNGGPAVLPFEEPNRLWKFDLPDPRFLRVQLIGDGRDVTTDAIGTQVRVTVKRRRDNVAWELFLVKRAGSGFGAQNGPDLVFGLGDADRVEAIQVTWPDGVRQAVTPPDGTQDWLQVFRL